MANSNQFGNNFTIAPRASLSDGLLDVVIVTSQNKLSLLLQTFRQLTGRNKLQTDAVINKDKAVIYFQASKLTIHNPQSAPLHIDGEPAETPETLQIQVKKKMFSAYSALRLSPTGPGLNNAINLRALSRLYVEKTDDIMSFCSRRER